MWSKETYGSSSTYLSNKTEKEINTLMKALLKKEKDELDAYVKYY